jgi:hypothetical protein
MLCVFCEREAALLSVNRYQPFFETHGAIEEPIEPRNHKGGKIRLTYRRASQIRGVGASVQGGLSEKWAREREARGL